MSGRLPTTVMISLASFRVLLLLVVVEVEGEREMATLRTEYPVLSDLNCTFLTDPLIST